VEPISRFEKYAIKVFILLIFDNFANYLNKRYRKSRDTGNIGYTRHRIKTNKAEKHSTKN